MGNRTAISKVYVPSSATVNRSGLAGGASAHKGRDINRRSSVQGLVARSSADNQAIACCRSSPHISPDGCSPAQHEGLSGRPHKPQRHASFRFAQRSPAGLPLGWPGIGVLIEGAIQQAAQAVRQSRIVGMDGLDAAVELPLPPALPLLNSLVRPLWDQELESRAAAAKAVAHGR